MSDVSNGAGGPLAGWALVQSNGITLVGKIGDASLSPVFEMRTMVIPDRNGGVNIAHLCIPVHGLTIREQRIPAGSLVTPCEELSPQERVRLHKSLQVAADMLEQMRAEAVGITLAKSLPTGGKVG